MFKISAFSVHAGRQTTPPLVDGDKTEYILQICITFIMHEMVLFLPFRELYRPFKHHVSRMFMRTNRVHSWLILFESCCQRNRRHDSTTCPLLRLLSDMDCLRCKVSVWNEFFNIAHDQLSAKLTAAFAHRRYNNHLLHESDFNTFYFVNTDTPTINQLF